MIASLIGLSADSDDIVQSVKHAVKRGNIALVVNMRRSQSPKAVVDVLKQYAYQVVEAVY